VSDGTTDDLPSKARCQRLRVVHTFEAGVIHRACHYDPAAPREMHRTTLAGDEPIR
jgi:hypothetical protein